MEDKREERSIALRKADGNDGGKRMVSLLDKMLGVKQLKLRGFQSAVRSKFEQMMLLLQKRSGCDLMSDGEAREGTYALAVVPGGSRSRSSIEIFLQIDADLETDLDEAERMTTPLYVGVRQSRMDVMKQDLKSIGRSRASGLSDSSSLHDAIGNNLISLLDSLLHQGCEQHPVGKPRRERKPSRACKPAIDRLAPLHLAIKSKGLRSDRLLSIICLLVECGADVELRDKYGRTPLYLAVELRKPEVAKFLVVAGADVNSVTESSSTPLLAALLNADLASVRHLLERGARADVRNAKHESSLHVAIRAIDESKPRYEVARLLLANGVRINDTDLEKSTALHLALAREDFSLFYLLISRGSLINMKNSRGYTALRIAVARNLLEEAKILLKLGANVNDCSNCKGSILAEAVEQGNEEMIRLLVRHNANIADRNSVLVAADNGNVAVMKILMDEGADINVVDKMGLSVLVHAILFKQNAMVQYLLENGADINPENKSFMPLTYCFLLYDFNGFVIRNPRDRESYKLTMNLILSHIALRSAQHLYIHEENIKLIRTKDIIRDKYEDYCRELVGMKRTKVSEDTWVSYLDLLVKRHNALVRCLRYAKVRERLLSGEYKRLFVEYSLQLEINCNKGLKRWLILSRLEEALYRVFESLLPSNVIYKICEYFTNDDVDRYFQGF